MKTEQNKINVINMIHEDKYDSPRKFFKRNMIYSFNGQLIVFASKVTGKFP